jgi:CRP/FNR family transcriptional regulator
VYSIHRGALKTYRVSPDSSEWISGFHFPGEVLGLDAVLDRPVRGGAVALNTVTVCLIPVPTLVDCFGRSGAMRSQLLARFGDEITRLEEHLSLDALSAERRLAAFILWVVNKLSDGSAQPSLSLPMSHKEIGNYLRLVPETVSRLLARFHERGWLSVRRRNVIVHDLEQLRLAAGGEHTDAAPAVSTPKKGAGYWSREAGSECS